MTKIMLATKSSIVLFQIVWGKLALPLNADLDTLLIAKFQSFKNAIIQP